MNDEITQLKEAEKRESLTLDYDTVERETTPAEEVRVKSRKGASRNRGLFPGLMLVLLGVFFLIGNLTGTRPDNWWAFFILIPAFAKFSHAWQSYQAHGRITNTTRHGLTAGLILTVVALVFLFNISWSLVWPVFLIIIGISALLHNTSR